MIFFADQKIENWKGCCLYINWKKSIQLNTIVPQVKNKIFV